jgi:hypothetical protein
MYCICCNLWWGRHHGHSFMFVGFTNIYLCNQYLSSLELWVCAEVYLVQLYVIKIIPQGTPISSINKTHNYYITEKNKTEQNLLQFSWQSKKHLSCLKNIDKKFNLSNSNVNVIVFQGVSILVKHHYIR